MTRNRAYRLHDIPPHWYEICACSCILLVCNLIPANTLAQKPSVALPEISTRDDKGQRRALRHEDLYKVERQWREQFCRKDAPDEVVALATDGVEGFGYLCLHGYPRELLQLLIFGKEGELRWYVNHSKASYFKRKLSAAEVAEIRRFLTDSKIDSLPEFEANIVDGTVHHYFHLTPSSGYRIRIKNPPQDPPLKEDIETYPEGDPAWQYGKLVGFFQKFKDPAKVTVHYSYPDVLPEMKVLFAHPTVQIKSIWKQDGDLCVGVDDTEDYGGTEYRKFIGGKFGKEVANPNLASNCPIEGLNLQARNTCCSPDGRWVAGISQKDNALICYDTAKKKYTAIKDKETRTCYTPLHYVEARRTFLLARFTIHPLSTDFPLYLEGYRLLDPTTGESTELEPPIDWKAYSWRLRPWYQALPRTFQKVAGKPNVVWAAYSIPELAESYVGSYDTKNFRWLSRQRIPFFQLQTKDIVVDEKERKIYAVCFGHILAFPLDNREE